MFENKNRQIQLEELAEKIYLENDSLHNEPFDFYKNHILDLYLDSSLSIDLVEKELTNHTDQDIPTNHTTIYSHLLDFISLMNQEGIDYYLTGALSCYVANQAELNRCYDDINFLINERDLGKFEDVCNQLNLHYEDNRMSSPRVLIDGVPSGDYEVKVSREDDNFHVGIFCFERLADGTIISKQYYHDENNQPCCREDIFSSNLAKLIFKKDSLPFKGQFVCVISPEYVYYLKEQSKNDKDKSDIEYLKDKIDFEKLEKLKETIKSDCYIQCAPVFSLPPLSRLNLKKMENDNSDISQMIMNSNEEEEEKSLVVDDSSMNGFAKKGSLFMILMIALICILILFFIIQIIKI